MYTDHGDSGFPNCFALFFCIFQNHCSGNKLFNSKCFSGGGLKHVIVVLYKIICKVRIVYILYKGVNILLKQTDVKHQPHV